jgi:UDP-3-O-[3-hydroxymyristoyl] N-acetylglucosamine deacetylase
MLREYSPAFLETEGLKKPHQNVCPPARSLMLPLAQKKGVGIHTGKNFCVSVEKSSLEGIRFSYLENGILYDCPALWDRLSGTTRTTALVMRGESRKKIQVSMIEHFMAAAHIWRLNQIEAKLSLTDNSPTKGVETIEVPILDGSALEWCQALRPSQKKLSQQSVWIISKDFEYSDGERKIRFEANSRPYTDYFFEGSFGVISQKASFSMNWASSEKSQEEFLQKIAPARTFGFLHEVEALRARGLALGGSLDNALIINGNGFVNPEGERVENELASHKLLDAIGDFALAGKPILGKIFLKSAGHALHLRALQLAFENKCLQPGFLMGDGRTIAQNINGHRKYGAQNILLKNKIL